MKAKSISSPLRERLWKVPKEQPATLRELALRSVRASPRDAFSWVFLSKACVELFLFEDARRALKTLKPLAGRPFAHLVWHGLARCSDAAGDLRGAERWYRKCLPRMPSAWIFLGAVLAKQGRLAEAKRTHLRASLLGPSFVDRDEAFLNVAMILRSERNYTTALKYLNRALELDPQYVIAAEVKADVQAAISILPPQENKVHWRQMVDAWVSAPATSHELARHYVRRYPNSVGGWIVLAELLAGFARYDEAFAAQRQAVRLAKRPQTRFPDHGIATQWGELYTTKKDFKRAETWYRRAVMLRGSSAEFDSLGDCLLAQGRLTEARKCFARSIRLDPAKSGRAYFNLGLIARSRRQYPAALRNLDNALRMVPDHECARNARRDVLRVIKERQR
jgi:tetratricopeptide (TPR) repeat protein